MNLKESLIKEYKSECAVTVKHLENLTDEVLSYQPHEKSFGMLKLCKHIANLPRWIELYMTTKELDWDANWTPPAPIEDSKAAIVERFNESTANGLKFLEQMNEADLDETWVMRKGEKIFSSRTKYETLRGMVINHIVHHRAQIGVYLRLNNLPVPASYGNSADDKGMFA